MKNNLCIKFLVRRYRAKTQTYKFLNQTIINKKPIPI